MTISDWVAFWYAEGDPMTPAEVASYYAGWTQLGFIDKGADDESD